MSSKPNDESLMIGFYVANGINSELEWRATILEFFELLNFLVPP